MAMPIWLREKLFQKRNLFNLLKQHDKNFNEIEKNWQELINSPYDPENYFKPEGTK